MTLEEARARVAGEAEEERRRWRESPLDARQNHEGRRDGLAFAKKLLAKAGKDAYAAPIRELERLRKQALQSARFPIGDMDKARRYSEAWAYRKAIELLGGGGEGGDGE